MRSNIQKTKIKLAQGENLDASKRERTSRYKPGRNHRRLPNGLFPGHGKNQDNGLFPGYGKKHDKVMERSMTRLWKKT